MIATGNRVLLHLAGNRTRDGTIIGHRTGYNLPLYTGSLTEQNLSCSSGTLGGAHVKVTGTVLDRAIRHVRLEAHEQLIRTDSIARKINQGTTAINYFVDIGRWLNLFSNVDCNTICGI